jgi:ABC-2 type transport system ATP-binding protein
MSSAPGPRTGGQAVAVVPGPSAVVVEDVSYRFGEHTAVDHVDLAIEPGETFGLLGPNGAGKTTTIRMLITLLKPMTGRISVFGTDTRAHPMRVRRMIGYVPQLLRYGPAAGAG